MFFPFNVLTATHLITIDGIRMNGPFLMSNPNIRVTFSINDFNGAFDNTYARSR